MNREVFVTVSDGNFKTLSHLTTGNFRATIDDKPIQIVSLTENAVPKRVAFLIDGSGSMRDGKYVWGLRLAAEILPYVGHETRFAVFLFGEKLYRFLDFADPPGLLKTKELPAEWRYAHGRTGLFDAVGAVVQSLDHSGPDDAVLVFTDGGDNHSKLMGSKLRPVVMKSGVRVYALLTPNYSERVPEEVNGPEDLLSDVIEPSGGQLISVDPQPKAARLPRDAHSIMGQLEIPYRLEIKLPERLAKDSKWKMELQGTDPKLAKKFHLIYPQELAACNPVP